MRKKTSFICGFVVQYIRKIYFSRKKRKIILVFGKNMQIKLNENLITLSKLLPKSLYAVGGVVRNSFLGSEETDVDLASANNEEDFLTALEKSGFTVEAVYKRTGTVMFKGLDGVHYEHTRFRKEKYGKGGTHTPETTEFTDDITLDAKRRDFKCNAVYYDIKNQEVVDPLGGVEDIKNRVLDTVDLPEKVFCFDGLRLLRLCRFCGELGFTPTKEVVSGATKYKNNIKDISPERILEELKKMSVADKKYSFSKKTAHYDSFKLCHKIGVLELIIPELTLGENMSQRSDFHDYDVLEHSFRSLLYADESVRFAALLHDVGKPYAMICDGYYTMHATYGAAIAERILKRLKAPKKFTEEVCRLTLLHMLDLDLQTGENKVRRYIADNYDIFDKLMLVKQADFSACKDDTSTAPTVEKWQSIRKKMIEEGVPFSVNQLKINGADLQKLGFKGKSIGEVLNELFYNAIINPKINDKEKLLSIAKNKLKGVKI